MSIEARVIDALEARFTPRATGIFRVCLVVPQSGALGMVGPSALEAAVLAVHEVNVAGGVRGSFVDLVLVDGGREPATVAAEVADLCSANAVDVVTGLHTSDVHRAVESAVARRTPYVFTPPHEGGQREPGVVCTGTDPGRQLRRSIEWLTVSHSLRSWALIGNDYIWPRSVHQVARRLIADVSSRVVLEQLVTLGQVLPNVDRMIDQLRRSRADAVLLSLVGRDLAVFNSALRHSGLDRRLVRLSGSLEENGLLALGGDQTGTMYAAMSSFASLVDDRRMSLHERYHALFGPEAPVLDSYAEGLYDGVHLVAALGTDGSLSPERLASATARRLAGASSDVYLARAEGFDFSVISH